MRTKSIPPGTFSRKPDSSTYRLTDIDGTVSDFKLKGTTWALDSSHTAEQASTTSYVYDTANSRALLTKVINPVEPGVDDTNACKATLVKGCEVLEYVYATSTSGGLSQTVFGDYVDHVKQVKIWAWDETAQAVTAVVVAEYRYDVDGELREVWDPRVSPALKTAYDYGTDGRVVSATPPGLRPWLFDYAEPDVDAAALRWDLDETSGTTATDSSGNGRNGTLASGVGRGMGNDPTRTADRAATFTMGSGQQITPTGTVIATNQSFTVSAWVNDTEAASSWRDAVAVDGSVSFGFQLGYDAGAGRWGFAMASTDTTNPVVHRAQSTSVPVKGAWTHLTGVYDHSAGQIRLYVNGTLQATTSHTSSWNATGTFAAGRAKWNGSNVNWWSGSIDDVRADQKALSADQVANLAVDENPGRLLRVRRDALQQGSPTTVVGTNSTNVVYHVPLTYSAGGPYNLDAGTAVGWAQADFATDATALFGPEDAPATNSATPTVSGNTGYPYAVVHYLNPSGREVNTATPGGHIDTVSYDKFGNVTRTLQATDREIALATHPDSATYLAELGLSGMDAASRAMELSTVNTYSTDGVDLLTTTGPRSSFVLESGWPTRTGPGRCRRSPPGRPHSGGPPRPTPTTRASRTGPPTIW